jgi:predicted transcriptional regulator
MSRCIVGVKSPNKRQGRNLSHAKSSCNSREVPSVWFPSTSSLAAVLSDENRALLRIIESTKPGSLAKLAELTGRKPSNLSRTLKTLASYGLVDIQRSKGLLVPVAKATEFLILLD